MSRAENLKNNCFYIVVGTLFTSALSNALLVTTYISLTGFQVTLAAFVMTSILCVCYYSRRTFAVSSGLLMLAMLGLLIYLWRNDFDVEWFARFSDWARELYGHIQGLTPYKEEYSVLGYGVVLAFAWFAAVFIRTGAGFYLLSILGFAVVGMISFTGYYLHGIHANSVLLVSGSLLMLKMTRSASRRDDEDGSYHVISSSGLLLIPLCFAMLVAAAAIPQPQAASSSNVRQNIAENAYNFNEYLLDRFGPKYFTFSSTGFSRAGGRLGGDISPNDRPVMDVHLFTRSNALPYLAGAYRDTYTGDRWVTTSQEKTPAQTFETVEGVSRQRALWYYLPDFDFDMILLELYGRYFTGEYENQHVALLAIESAYNSGKVRITPRRPTTTVFTPANKLTFRHSESPFDPANPSVHSDESGAGAVYVDGAGTVSTENAMRRGTFYTVEYIEAAIINETVRARLDEMFAASSFDYSDERMARYLTLPESLPRRVRDLAEYITKDASNPYEKMKLLEEYLIQYPYTLTPGELPAGEDFVDWFLFEGREGYCSYYASALAVMGRCVGVPTRYAEGFTLPQDAGVNGVYEVTNAQAHAWVDAFFPMTGWLTFEATAPYNYPFYHGGERPTLQTGEPERPADDEEELDDFIEEFEREHTVPTLPGETGEEEELLDEGSKIAVAVLVAAIVALAVAARYYFYCRKLQKLESLPPREGAIAYFARIVGVLASNGVALEPQETALTFARRVDNSGALNAEGFTMEQLAGIFSRARYGNEEVPPEDLSRISRCYNILTARPGAPAMERAAAWIERYILGKY